MSTAVSDIELTSAYRAALPELAVDWEAAEMPDPRLVAFNDTLAAGKGRHAGGNSHRMHIIYGGHGKADHTVGSFTGSANER